MNKEKYKHNMINKVINLALSEVGYKETGTNITKYAKDFDTKYPDFYNTRKNGASWCDIFFDWLIVSIFGFDNALKVLNQPKKSCGAGCSFSYSYYKNHSKTPDIGYQIFFKDSSNKPVHTGIVYKVDDKKVYTIEGNKSNQVKKCSYNLNSSKIYGYGIPDYSVGYTEDPIKEDPAKEDIKPITNKTYVVTAPSGLRIRKEPNTTSKIIKVLKLNTKITGSVFNKEWIKVSDGYMYAKWLKEVK